MNIEYVGRHCDIDDDIRKYAESKLKKATRFLEEPIDMRLTLEGERHRRIAELHVAHRFGVLDAREVSSDLRDSILQVVEKIEKQARRTRKKAKGKKRRATGLNGSAWPVEILEAASLGTSASPRIIKSSRLYIEPMSLEEAAQNLEGSKNDFIIFRNLESDQINVLYRRRDANFGLISPEA